MNGTAVVLDIEGTVGSAAHVHDVLFPYARQRLPRWFADHRGTERAVALIEEIRVFLGAGSLNEAVAVATLTEWTDRDVKAPALKKIQGWIWEAGYADGSLTGHVYAEIPQVLRRWHASGAVLHVYSSGSVASQVNWFAHTAYGDLTPLLHGYFDLDNAGSKQSAASYRRIGAAIGTPADATLFLSDSGAELDAAADAGWLTVAVRRADDPRPRPVPGHPTIGSLDEQDLDQLMKGT
ncbi:acireductone synthase [Streptomyces luteolus]|uniref:Acireductone synthase n=1 Tax=Streptomyces luteolus TaxID=3043615 RepID=A0ABT6SW82_9ACTN|nr:acireductone synthase [Streptomyces sp. B-S-A12]MDI3419846.1 acireductone synthase [Streptomyces sp. B-S-A12]